LCLVSAANGGCRDNLHRAGIARSPILAIERRPLVRDVSLSEVCLVAGRYENGRSDRRAALTSTAVRVLQNGNRR